jgi:hypothetical protein
VAKPIFKSILVKYYYVSLSHNEKNESQWIKTERYATVRAM